MTSATIITHSGTIIKVATHSLVTRDIDNGMGMVLPGVRQINSIRTMGYSYQDRQDNVNRYKQPTVVTVLMW